MESGFLVLGLLGLAALVGGLVSFFSMFSKGDQKTKLWQFEQELKQLKKQLEALEGQVKNTQSNAEVIPLSSALKANLNATQTVKASEETAASTYSASMTDAYLGATELDTTESEQTASNIDKPSANQSPEKKIFKLGKVKKYYLE